MNNRTIIVADFETSSVNPYDCDVFQLSALALDPIRLEILPNSIFNMWIKPDNFERPTYYKEFKSTLDFHCKNFKCSIDEFLDKIKNATPEKNVWEQFNKYLSQYHTRQSTQSIFTAPSVSAFNLFDFDLPILDRLCIKYKNVDKNGRPNIFFRRNSLDIMHVARLWLEPTNELRSFSMDAIRDYFGIDKSGAHEGVKDITDEAAILLKFLKLHVKISSKINFKNSFAVEYA